MTRKHAARVVSSKCAYADFENIGLKQLFFLKKYGRIF